MHALASGCFLAHLAGMSHLYIIEIGGTRPDSLFEVHIVHVLVAPDEAGMIEACRTAFGHVLGAPHIDGWVAIAVERDDPAIPLPEDEHCYLIEVGRNSATSLREEHDYRFIQAADARAAIVRLRAEAPGWHIDTVVDVDRLALERGWRRRHRHAGAAAEYRQAGRYIRFDRM